MFSISDILQYTCHRKAQNNNAEIVNLGKDLCLFSQTVQLARGLASPDSCL